MGSLSATGIFFVSKTNATIRKRDIRITSENAETDTVTNLVTTPHTRAISSGSIIRDDGSVLYTEDKVWGVYRMGRSTTERIASDADASRSIVVDLPPLESGTVVVIPDSLDNDVPQVSLRHTGDKVVKGQAVGDTVVERLADSGVFDTGFPL